MPEAKATGACLVVGASRGIGLALAAALLAGDRFTRVIATHRPGSGQTGLQSLRRRHGERLHRLELEVTDPRGLEDLGDQLQRIGGIDLALHVAGILHEPDLQPEKSLEDCEPRSLQRLFEVNSIAPLMMARTVFAAQGRQQRFTFAALSAMVGSIADNRLGGWYGYRASKAALNQFIKTLAIESRRRYPNATVLAIHPGTTDTGLSQPFQRNVAPGRLYSTATTAERVLEVVRQAGPESSGHFLNWDGTVIPW
jgi:NAD(P)-dependent dehydrogenase (short-subunit alcohol dehydrogenase family)